MQLCYKTDSDPDANQFLNLEQFSAIELLTLGGLTDDDPVLYGIQFSTPEAYVVLEFHTREGAVRTLAAIRTAYLKRDWLVLPEYDAKHISFHETSNG